MNDVYCKHCERPRAACPVAQAAEAGRWLENRRKARSRVFNHGGEISRTLGSNRAAYLPK
ncbi:hypothetical protein GCM10010244_06080 [Streptomyces coeruleorubidus]|nr:hypothetical protein GCM10010244_06080 [Streptomyces bellus]